MRPPFGRVIAALLLIAAAFAIPAAAQTPPDAANLKKALEHLKDGEFREADALGAKMSDPAARNLVTWLAIRLTPKDIGFDRIQAFIRQNPHWPSPTLIRRRAESLLLSEKRDPKTVLGYFGNAQPVSGDGMIVLARALIASNNQAHALGWLRRAWREEELTGSLEQEILSAHGSLLTSADHKARADRLFYLEKFEAAQRAAERASKDVALLSKARNAALQRAGNAKSLLDAVPAHLRKDASYLYARAYLARRGNDAKAAAEFMLQAP
ncbi:MAG TPA: lytic transglycosylase domain-containing protein, partial [Xanthobacteraceae bacterium]|nr:lytic transglycosylase domain-containing protein [Xanthobacteraceae bacterium]